MPVLNNTCIFLEFWLTNTKSCQVLIWAPHQPTSETLRCTPVLQYLNASARGCTLPLPGEAFSYLPKVAVHTHWRQRQVAARWPVTQPFAPCVSHAQFFRIFFFATLFLNPQIWLRAHQGFYEQWSGLRSSVWATALLVYSCQESHCLEVFLEARYSKLSP